MHYADIIAALHKTKHPPARVAEALAVRPSTVSMVIRGRTTSRRIADYIAKTTGISIHRLWPGRYDKQPSRKEAA